MLASTSNSRPVDDPGAMEQESPPRETALLSEHTYLTPAPCRTWSPIYDSVATPFDATPDDADATPLVGSRVPEYEEVRATPTAPCPPSFETSGSTVYDDLVFETPAGRQDDSGSSDDDADYLEIAGEPPGAAGAAASAPRRRALSASQQQQHQMQLQQLQQHQLRWDQAATAGQAVFASSIMQIDEEHLRQCTPAMVTQNLRSSSATFRKDEAVLLLSNLKFRPVMTQTGRIVFVPDGLIRFEKTFAPRLPPGRVAKQVAQLSYHHGAIARDEAEIRLLTNPECRPGLFLTRVKDELEGENILSVVSPTMSVDHYLLQQDPTDDIVTINGQRLADDCSTIDDLVAILLDHPPGLCAPVLEAPCQPPGPNAAEWADMTAKLRRCSNASSRLGNTTKKIIRLFSRGDKRDEPAAAAGSDA